jgi:2-oxo-4-hydroxy-4-carboxy--5-ureidoimidazoline (OHCU) decarboxylase
LGESAAGAARGAAWSAGEQAGAAAAAATDRARLLDANARYRQRFGYTFILFATGKDAGAMLAACETRLRNSPAAELPVAAQEQRQITRLRLDKLLGGA